MYTAPTSVNYCRPTLCDGPNQGSPVPGQAYPLPGAVFRAGDILELITVGTLVFPAPASELASVVPIPLTQSAVAYGSASTNPLQILYGFYTLSDGTNESMPSAWFTLVVPAGDDATITVPIAGAPAAATEWNLYLGTNPFQAWQQVASTALGSPASVPNPLTNYSGAARATTNASTNILGLANDDYDVLFQQGPPQAITSNRRLFGGDMTAFDPEQYQVKYAKLSNGQRFVISVIQPFNSGMLNQGFGINYTSQNVYALDSSQSNKIVQVVEFDDNLDNWPTSAPFLTGITGAQVIAAFTSGVLA